MLLNLQLLVINIEMLVCEKQILERKMIFFFFPFQYEDEFTPSDMDNEDLYS